jgi:phasin family protein
MATKKSAQSASAQAALRSIGAPAFDPAAAAAAFRMPQLDAETMATAQRRNVEALTSVCQLAFDCVQASAQRQAQVFRDTAEELLTSYRDIGRAGSPQDQATAQLNVNRHALERGMDSLRELAELIARTNTEAFEIINKRATNCMQELQSAVKPEQSAKR